MFLRASAAERSYSRGVLRRGLAALLLAHLLVDLALVSLPFDDGWADDLDLFGRLGAGTLYVFVFLSMATVVVSFACWSCAAWMATSRGEHVVGWVASLLAGFGVWWAFERFHLDAWSLVATLVAQVGAAAAVGFVVPRDPELA